jgi:outer membrane protein TolC
MMWMPCLTLLLAVQVGPAPGAAVYGGVPSGEAQAEPLALSLTDAVDRGLQHNLALLLAEQRVRHAQGERWEALSDLLPHLSGEWRAERQKISLEAFGFSSLPGLPGLPTLVGPFNVFDVRASVTERVVDVEAFFKQRSEREHVAAARHTYQETRDLVILVCGNLYLQAVAEQSRIDAAQAAGTTAQALYEQAADRKRSGLVPSIDVLRADVESKTRQQQLIVAENRSARARLALGRAIGLPAGQEIRLTDRLPEALPPAIPVAPALARAYASRSDWQAAQAEVQAAESARHAAGAGALPSVELNADYGAIGQTMSGAHVTYDLGASVRVPVLQGGKVHGKVLKADADLESARAELEELRGRIDFEVRTAILDLAAAARRVDVARSAAGLAEQQLEQARDRFGAGVASNLDVVQAQQSLAGAHESYIEALYDQSVARAAMAHALGAVESSYKEFVAAR